MKNRRADDPDYAPVGSQRSNAALLHELQVHQVELEAQNTELVRVKLELECTLDNYTALYEHAPLAYLIVSPDATVLQVNRKGADMLGAAPERLRGCSLLDFFEDGDRDRVAGALDASYGADLLSEAVPLEVELESLTRDQRHVVSLEVTRNSPAESALVMMSDVTERRELEQALLDSSHREQLRLAADIHDGLAQELAGLCMRITAMARESERQVPLKAGELRECVSEMVHALGECRSLARGLSPFAAYQGGLTEALRQLALHAEALGGPTVAFHLNEAAPVQLPARHLDHLYRIAQEGVSNARRHSGAQSIDIRLDVQSSAVTLAVVDDGCGVTASKGGSGLGLRLMRHRVALMGAHLSLQSAPGGGTQILCTVAQPPSPSPPVPAAT